MKLEEILAAGPKREKRKRVGRGVGSGRGKTATRGTKGQYSRAGATRRGLAEGGQMPLYRRLPHRGFNNARFREERPAIVNVGQLDRVFESGATVDLASCQQSGLVKKNARSIKVLGLGDVTKELVLRVDAISAAARAKIEAASGTVEPVS